MSVNDITGDALKTKVPSDKFKSNYDLIDWGNKEKIIEKLDEVIEKVTDLDNKVKENLHFEMMLDTMYLNFIKYRNTQDDMTAFKRAVREYEIPNV